VAFTDNFSWDKPATTPTIRTHGTCAYEVRPLEAGWQDRMPIQHLREQLSLVAQFGATPETMTAIARTIMPFRKL
jgi:hypothetical protein